LNLPLNYIFTNFYEIPGIDKLYLVNNIMALLLEVLIIFKRWFYIDSQRIQMKYHYFLILKMFCASNKKMEI